MAGRPIQTSATAATPTAAWRGVAWRGVAWRGVASQSPLIRPAPAFFCARVSEFLPFDPPAPYRDASGRFAERFLREHADPATVEVQRVWSDSKLGLAQLNIHHCLPGTAVSCQAIREQASIGSAIACRPRISCSTRANGFSIAANPPTHVLARRQPFSSQDRNSRRRDFKALQIQRTLGDGVNWSK